MTNNPDAIRADIEETRRELGSDVDALADKVSPSKMAQRQTRKLRSVLGSVKDTVMGATDDAKDAAASAGDSIAEAGHTAVAKAQGNPLAVGLIAFGVGWLAASLIPASEKEKELASQVKEAAQPLVQNVADAAKDVAENLREPAQDAVGAVKDTATDAVQSVRAEASMAVDDVKDQAAEAKHAVQEGNA